jgi:hypothetical protein
VVHGYHSTGRSRSAPGSDATAGLEHSIQVSRPRSRGTRSFVAVPPRRPPPSFVGMMRSLRHWSTYPGRPSSDGSLQKESHGPLVV